MNFLFLCILFFYKNNFFLIIKVRHLLPLSVSVSFSFLLDFHTHTLAHIFFEVTAPQGIEKELGPSVLVV